MKHYVPLLEEYTLDLQLEYLLESENGIANLKNRLAAIFDDATGDKALELFKHWAEKASRLNTTTKIAFVTLLVTLMLGKVPAEALSKADIRDPQTKEMIDLAVKKKSNDQTKEFLDAMAHRESSDNWKAAKRGRIKGKDGVTRHADYVGKYQFGYYAFKEIGKNQIKYDQFKRNPNSYPEAEQDADMIRLMKRNQHYLRNHKKHIGRTISGVDVTESGIIAAAHLVGNKAVRDFLDSNGKTDKRDGNGVRCSDYMKEFQGYNLKI